MLSLGNPAEELHRVLTQFQQQAHPQRTVDECWAEALAIPVAEIPDALGALLGLIPQISTTLNSLDRGRLLATCSRYKAAWSQPFLARQTSSQGLINEDSLHALLGIAEAISNSSNPSPTISDSDRQRLTEILEEACSEVRQDRSLPIDFRSLLLSRLGDIIWALDHLHVVGMDGLQAAMERLTGVVATTPMQTRTKPSLKKVVAALGLVWVVFSHGADVQDNIEAWRQIVPGIESAVQQYAPKQLGDSMVQPREEPGSSLEEVDAGALND